MYNRLNYKYSEEKMKIELKQAFLDVFNEPKWINKFIVGILLVSVSKLTDAYLAGFVITAQKSTKEVLTTAMSGHLVATVIFLKILAGIMYLFVWGYMIKYAHNKINDITPSLLKWGNYFKNGLCYFSILIFYVLLILFIIFPMRLSKQYMELMLYFLFFLISPIIYFATILYAKNLNLNDAFDFKKIFSIFSKVIGKSYFYSFIIFCIAILGQILNDVIKLVHMNYPIKVPFIISCGFIEFWVSLASIALFVQIYKSSKNDNSVEITRE